MKIKSLSRNSDFKRAYFKGVRKSSKNISIYVRRVFSDEVQFGITASKKIGCAVERNRARRLIREACRILGPISGYHIVIVAHRSILECKMRDVHKEICFLLKCLKIG